MTALTQWFLTGRARLPKGASINFQGGASPCALHDICSFINKFTNKYRTLAFKTYLKLGGLKQRTTT